MAHFGLFFVLIITLLFTKPARTGSQLVNANYPKTEDLKMGKTEQKIDIIESALKAVLEKSNDWDEVKDKISVAFNSIDYLSALICVLRKGVTRD